MSEELDKIFIKQNLIDTSEHLSASGKYKLVIEKYKTTSNTWNYTKGTVYSTNTGEWIGEIKRNYPIFPYLFFVKKNTEYLISGRTYMSQTIINCNTGHVYDNTDDTESERFCWSQMWQVDESTLCVCGCFWGGPYMYSFYDFSNLSLGWKELNVKRIGNLPMPKYDYILTNNDLIGQDNHPEPVIENGMITFIKKETRIFGIGVSSKEVRELDMEYEDYKKQKGEINGFTIPFAESKKYQLELAVMKYKRYGDDMVLFDFWRDERQMELDGNRDKEDDYRNKSQRLDRIYKLIENKFKNGKYNIRYYNVYDYENGNLSVTKFRILLTLEDTRSIFYLFEFESNENTEIKVHYRNLCHPNQNSSVAFLNEDFIVNIIE